MAQPNAPTSRDRADLAGDTVRRIMHIAAAMRHYQDVGIGELGLTPAAARALHELDPDRPLPARDLAARLGCDRSNVTALVDKLEQAGLVERRGDPADRRQKTLVVTDAGRRVRERVRQVMSDSRLLDGLGADELASLRELVWKVSDGGCPERCGED
ncbi:MULTISPECIES: MarR family winged helix-turn-helix transcriptional regulator [Micromonospora]|uniref:MarR family transcriptional regulator n=1 Tax=Micromonospora solifontis TaxID=2487138 RepID=A0ABX9WEN2_9ACTN|nr:MULTISPECIES: MarR family winged helix-turn-helix transcriptional regulator [Micromonospora]NES13943.1 winged helix-turn-helix transcriptional regulator [Micromonospora sp. PPF5-17B]NES37498.1 winged helix-turn-helix transcriptional regulator [Micromonospora solifontis]NES54043.1 winged helix-turn-helix transcriptional regulator [Micromonospora sp. PPF5-6]RNL98305.1 MarR family transcriptional regulator [Micromonospora solifontis]